MKTQIIAVLALFLSVSIIFAQEKVVVAGSGNLNDEITDIAKAYMAKNPGDVIDVRQEHMSTTGGIEGVQSGRLQIGLISRRLTDQEKNKLVYRALARSIAVVSVNKAIAITSLSETQICDIFSGKITSWKEVGGGELKVTVLSRKRDDGNFETFRAKMPCFKDLKITPDAISLSRGNEVLSAIDKRPGTVGLTVWDRRLESWKTSKHLPSTV